MGPKVIWWETDHWRAYEAAYQPKVPRVQELAEATWQTRVIDLSLSEEELWRGVRKSYHAIIHGAERAFIVEDWTAMCAVQEAHRIHAASAGRETRTPETWDLMAEWLTQRQACLVGAERMGELGSAFAFAYLIIWGQWAYYASGASLELNVQHALIWRAMKELKARGVRYFEIGWMERDGDSEKERGIVKFKQGFGGVDMPANEAPKLCGLSPSFRHG